MIAIAESPTTNGAAAIGFTEPMEDESHVLTPEVVAKVDANLATGPTLYNDKRIRTRCKAIQMWQQV